MCAAAAPRSLVALMPTSQSFAVMVGILGDYMGMVNVPANTKEFPNDGIFRMGHVILLTKPRGTRLSVLRMLEEMMKVSQASSLPGE
jgi:hypothetical protein